MDDDRPMTKAEFVEWKRIHGGAADEQRRQYREAELWVDSFKRKREALVRFRTRPAFG